MAPLLSQVHAFGVMILAGVVIGLLFDCYRVVRSFCHPRSTTGLVLDLLFWIAATPAAFMMLIIGNWGQLRSYVVLGMGVGLFGYFQIAGPLVRWGLLSVIRRLSRLAMGAVYWLSRMATAPMLLWRGQRFWRRGFGIRPFFRR